jgi:hypothetical protein
MASQSPFNFILKVAALWIALLVLPFTERTLLGLQTYNGLFIGLGLVFVMYGLTSIQFLLFCSIQSESRVTSGLRSAVVFVYLLHSGCLCFRV